MSFKQLEPRQQELYKALVKKNLKLGEKYLGAIIAYKQKDNPERFVHSAHSIRDMMNFLPDHTDVPKVEGAKRRLGDLMGPYEQKWDGLIEKSGWPGEPEWTGEIDSELREFLRSSQSFFEENKSIRTTRKDQAKSIYRHHNHLSVPLPEDIEDLKAKQWQKYNGYFTGIAHGGTVDEKKFMSYLQHFEVALLDIIHPRTFDTHTELDEIIEEGEGNANERTC